MLSSYLSLVLIMEIFFCPVPGANEIDIVQRLQKNTTRLVVWSTSDTAISFNSLRNPLGTQGKDSIQPLSFCLQMHKHPSTYPIRCRRMLLLRTLCSAFDITSLNVPRTDKVYIKIITHGVEDCENNIERIGFNTVKSSEVIIWNLLRY